MLLLVTYKSPCMNCSSVKWEILFKTYSPCHMLCRKSNGIFSYYSFSCRSMSCHEDRVSHFKMVHCFLLKSVQLKWVLCCICILAEIGGFDYWVEFLMCHIRDKFVEIRHGLVHIYYVCPFSFLYRRSLKRFDRSDYWLQVWSLIVHSTSVLWMVAGSLTSVPR